MKSIPRGSVLAEILSTPITDRTFRDGLTAAGWFAKYPGVIAPPAEDDPRAAAVEKEKQPTSSPAQAPGLAGVDWAGKKPRGKRARA